MIPRLGSIGIAYYLGYALTHWADFYALRHVLVLGRVMTGAGCDLILAQGCRVLDAKFPVAKA